MKPRPGAFIPVALWMTLIFLLSGRPTVSVSHEFVLNFLFFKTLHIFEYAVLFLLSYRAFSGSLDREKKPEAPVYAFVVTILYAAFDEIHQMFVPTREGTVRDVIIDGLGAVFAWISIASLRPKLPLRLRRWLKA